MMDKVHDNYLLMRQQDLILLPKLNCTQDVMGKIKQPELILIESLESLQHNRNAPKVFGQMTHTPSPAEIKTNIEECEKMKIESIKDAEEVLSTGASESKDTPVEM